MDCYRINRLIYYRPSHHSYPNGWKIQLSVDCTTVENEPLYKYLHYIYQSVPICLVFPLFQPPPFIIHWQQQLTVEAPFQRSTLKNKIHCTSIGVYCLCHTIWYQLLLLLCMVATDPLQLYSIK